jgi:hypothetical protein
MLMSTSNQTAQTSISAQMESIILLNVRTDLQLLVDPKDKLLESKL